MLINLITIVGAVIFFLVKTAQPDNGARVGAIEDNSQS